MAASVLSQAVQVVTPQATLEGQLTIPREAAGLVLFAHGSGSGRFSRRNQFVAESLNHAGLATLLFDLLTDAESRLDEQTAELRFKIELLAERVVGAIDWTQRGSDVSQLPIGLFGASTGAAAALVAAAERPAAVQAVVSRGGRPDLAGAALSQVTAPTLLIVGGADFTVLALNRRAAGELRAAHQLAVIPGATHLFEEPGALAQVAQLAADWFRQYLT